MAGRALVFSNPEIIRSLSTDFVAVAGDDWYRRRQDDPTGAFYRKVALQRGPWDGDVTRQGLYAFAPSGKLLAFRNTTDLEPVKRLLKDALARWRELPESKRAPGAEGKGEGDGEREGDGDREARGEAGVDAHGARKAKGERKEDVPTRDDPSFTRPVPEGAIVLRVHARELEEKDDGALCKAPPRGRFHNLGSIDRLWILPEEWRRIAAAMSGPEGSIAALEPAVARRIARFHLVDNTRGEPPFWGTEEVRELSMHLRVVSRDADRIVAAIEGHVRLETRRGDRGYEARIAGRIEHAPASAAPRRLDIVAAGEHWGQGRYTPDARAGRSPLGVAAILVGTPMPADRIPPQAARDLDGYLRAR